MTTQHIWLLIAAGFALQWFVFFLIFSSLVNRLCWLVKEHVWAMHEIARKLGKIADSLEDEPEDDSQDFK